MVCEGKDLPQLHPNIKKVLISGVNLKLTQLLDTLIINYLCDQVSIKINSDVTNLAIGVRAWKDLLWEPIDAMVSDMIYYRSVHKIIFWNIGLTSTKSHYGFDICGVKMIYIKPGTCIDNLVVGTSFLHIYKLDATIRSFRVINDLARGVNLTVYKDGVKTVYDLSKFPNSILDKSVYS